MNHINNDDINLYGCDISESMLNLARKTEAYHDLRISNLYEMLPYRDGKFDLIIACGVLGYVDSNMPLMEFERLLRPGGSLVFAFRQEHFVHHDYQDVLDRGTCTLKTKSVEFMDPFPNDPNFRHVYRVSLLTKKPKTQKA
jgi:SAM-dependent methyltransferase